MNFDQNSRKCQHRQHKVKVGVLRPIQQPKCVPSLIKKTVSPFLCLFRTQGNIKYIQYIHQTFLLFFLQTLPKPILKFLLVFSTHLSKLEAHSCIIHSNQYTFVKTRSTQLYHSLQSTSNTKLCPSM